MAQNVGQDHEHGERLSVREKLLYGCGQGAPGLADNAIVFFLIFYYTKVVRLDPGLIGTALMIGRLWDAFTDPVMGYISDETRARLGRRRTFMLLGAIPFGLSIVLLWNPFPGMTGNGAFWYLLPVFLLYSTSLTVIQVPYLTLGGELTEHYHERSSVIAFRQIFWAAAILIGGGAPPFIVRAISGVAYGKLESRPGWIVMSCIFGAICAGLMLTAGFGTRERVVPGPRNPLPLTKAVGHMMRTTANSLRNRHFATIAGVFLITQVAFAMTTNILPLLLADFLDLPGETMFPIMVALLVTTFPFLAFWPRVSTRWGKKRSYVYGLAILGVLSFQTLWAFQPGGWTGILYIYACIYGVGLASHFVFPWAIVPDIIDWDELERGERRDGSFFGAMTFLAKSSSALSLFIVGQLLELIQYDKAAEVQTDDTVFGLRIIYGVIPGVAFLAAMFLQMTLKVTQQRTAEVRRELEARRQAQEAAPA